VCGLRVKVKYFTTLRELARSSEEEIEIESDSSLGNLIEKIATKYGKEAHNYLYHKEGKIDPSIYFLVNGFDARLLLGFGTELREGDMVAIIPPIGGG